MNIEFHILEAGYCSWIFEMFFISIWSYESDLVNTESLLTDKNRLKQKNVNW